MRTIFAGGEVFDGTGSMPATADVVVEDDRIVDVGPGLDGDESVDVTGKTLLPGLFDCHTHVTISDVDLWKRLQEPFSYRFYLAAENLKATLDAGITSIRDAGGADLGIKRALQNGLIPGPRMQISIGMLSQTGGHGDNWMPSGGVASLFTGYPGSPDRIVDGADEMRRKVREMIRAGADVIKVATTGGVLSPSDEPTHAHFRAEELDVLVTEANAAGKWVMAHAQGTPGIRAAVVAGVRSIEHGIFLDDEVIELMLQRGTYLVPTLVAPTGVLTAHERGLAIPQEALRKANEVIEAHRESFRKAVAAGVKIAMGTDTGVTPHGENLRELELMAEGGMKPEHVLAATTSVAAELLGWQQDSGTIEAGKRADLVVVDGDPFDLAKLPDRIEAVYQDGVLVRG